MTITTDDIRRARTLAYELTGARIKFILFYSGTWGDNAQGPKYPLKWLFNVDCASEKELEKLLKTASRQTFP